jgi:hypothetical protein
VEEVCSGRSTAFSASSRNFDLNDEASIAWKDRVISCPKCEIRMMLVGVERGIVGPDLRTLECPVCELAYKTLAEANETENEAGWLKTELGRGE